MEKKIKKLKYNFDEIKLNLLILIFYLLLTLLMTYPLIFNISSSLPAGREAYVFVWNLWHTKQTLFQGTSPLYSNYIFYPKGVSLAFHSISMFNALLSIPLQLIFNLIITYNLLFLLSFILTGFGMYLLVFHITKNRKASFIAGLLLAFFPYHFAHITHLNLLSMQWIPFFILYFIKTFKERNIKNIIFSSIFLTLTALSSWYYLVFLVLFVITFFVYNIFSRSNYALNKRFIRCFILIFLLFGLFISPFVFPMLTSNEFYSEKTFDSSVAHSADIAAFFIPSKTHFIFGNYVEPFYNSINLYNGKIYGNIEESTVFLGYLTLIFVFFTIIKKYKKIRSWLLFAFVFFIFSLGPTLHFNGLVTFPVEGWDLDKIVQRIDPNINEDALEILKHNIVIPLPYIIFNFIPFFNILRNPSRFVVMIMLFLSIVVGVACTNIFNKMKRKKIFNKYNAENVLFSIFCLIIIFEFLSIPIELSSATAPDFYYSISKGNAQFSILDLPICNDTLSCYNPKLKSYQFYQTIHNKPIFVGVVSRYSKDTFDYIRNTNLNKFVSSESILNINEIDRKLLEENNVGFIVLHKNNLSNQALNHLKNLLSEYDLVYEDKSIISYYTFK